tara:strand:+ start:41828 stop:42040 length:213 start_codon:yes stop_codon:yes gene_type:complete
MWIKRKSRRSEAMMIKRAWRLWALSLGQKSGKDNKEADIVAGIRTVWVLFNLITCCFIMASGMVNLGWIG